MSWTITRYVARVYLASTVGILLTGLAIFLVADFVDRAGAYVGPHWVGDVAFLYANKALVGVQQLGPAALLLGAGASVTLLRRRGELTGLSALTFGPSAIHLPIAACALVFAGGLVLFDECFVVDAGRRVEEIAYTRFGRAGRDWRFFFSVPQWFRHQNRIYYLRGGDSDTGFVNATVYELSDDFRLSRRLDARRMSYAGGTRWEMEEVTERSFAHGGTTLARKEHEAYDLGTTDRPFRIRLGRPEQMRIGQLRQQIRARREGGLSTSAFSLGLHERFAYPLAGVPAALLAAALALRPGRKGYLTAALVEGVAIVMGLWAMMVILKTLTLAQHVPAALGAWAPTMLLTAAAATLWLRRERSA